MFVYVDMKYNGYQTTIWNGILSTTLTQAYFPNKGAEVWNAPTWFLSSLTLSTMLMPYLLPSLCTLSKLQLVKTGLWIYMIYILPKIGYCYDTNSFHIPEAMIPFKAIPNAHAFNIQRFHPLMNIAEVLLGIIACRIVMLDQETLIDTDKKKNDDIADTGTSKDVMTSSTRLTNGWSTAVPFLTILTFLWIRSFNIVPMSELLARGIIFVPMFLRLIMACHRQTVAGGQNDLILHILQHPWLVSFSQYVFPIFMIHGPIGQIFYKKLIATKLFGRVLYGPHYFVLYLFTTFVAAYLLQVTFVQNKYVQEKTNQMVQQLSKWF
jgi:hypothetical protein